MIGRTLSHFRIIAKIGEGGMGVVYRAEDERLRRPVALKVLPPELVGNEERRLRFLREARAAAAVNHPNIATIYDVGEAEGQVFIAMELVEGKTLRALIAGRPLPIGDAIQIAVGMAEGLARAHQAHVIHRDLKPENVIVSEEGNAKILDFGLAKLLEERDRAVDAEMGRLETLSGEMTRAGKVLGTVAYMSPEQARGETVDERSDLFSFGIVLYEMVTGRAPFQGRTATDTLSAVTRDAVVPASRLNPEVPARLEEVIAKCLEKSPRERYQHADELVVDLRRLRRTTDSGLQAVRASPAGRWRRAPVIAGALVAALVAALAILLGLNPGGFRDRLIGARSAGPIDSLAVLPLANLSGDPDQEYFADGMTEELIANLAKISALRVISRTSAMRYKGTRKPVPEIGRELNVDAIVEASVRRSGQRVRITAQLVQTATDRHLWAESYEGDLRDVLTLQSDVAKAIASEIRVKLTPQDELRLARARSIDPEAHEAYLKGRYYWNKRTGDGFKRAIEYFQRAIDKDPAYAQAYAGLADTFILFPQFVFAATKDVLPKARTAAAKAIEIDPNLAEAHTSMAAVRDMEWNWPAVETEYRRAIELDPNYATARHWYGIHLSWMGRFEDGLRELRRAEEIDPLSPIIKTDVARAYDTLGRYDEAIAKVREALDIDPNFVEAHSSLAWTLAAKGTREEAVAEFRNVLSLSPGNVKATAGLGYVEGVSGRWTAARKVLGQLRGRSRHELVPAYYLAVVHLGLGERNECFAWLEKAYEEKNYDPLAGVKADRILDPLHSDPRYQDLLRRIGLPPD